MFAHGNCVHNSDFICYFQATNHLLPLRIPFSFFDDLSQNGKQFTFKFISQSHHTLGTLSEILRCCFDFKYLRQWRRFDFSKKKEETFEIIREIFSRLKVCYFEFQFISSPKSRCCRTVAFGSHRKCTYRRGSRN